jgi:hypothetical protein
VIRIGRRRVVGRVALERVLRGDVVHPMVSGNCNGSSA